MKKDDMSNLKNKSKYKWGYIHYKKNDYNNKDNSIYY